MIELGMAMKKRIVRTGRHVSEMEVNKVRRSTLAIEPLAAVPVATKNVLLGGPCGTPAALKRCGCVATRKKISPKMEYRYLQLQLAPIWSSWPARNTEHKKRAKRKQVFTDTH